MREANVHMEREHLSELLQVSPESLQPGNLYDRELIPIRSPIDGVVIAGTSVSARLLLRGFVAFDISNLSTIWVTAAVNQTGSFAGPRRRAGGCGHHRLPRSGAFTAGSP